MKLKKMLASILAVAMVLSTMGAVVFADPAYVEVTDGYEALNGDVLTGGTGVESITVADDAEITLSGVNVQRITLNGDAIINLADGTTNDVNANGAKDGAVVVPKGGSLVINGDTGVLNAVKGKSSSYSAAIGSDRWGSTGSVTITINGGVINAEANYAAAIGGGKDMPATVIINGGTINAKSSYGAAIGGGSAAEATVTIAGGTVDAISSYGAAIGAGKEADAAVTISGGIVSAQGLFGAAIGAGQDSTGTTTISIANAEVTATVDPATHTSNPSSTRGITSAAIGASKGTAEITITDSTVNATSVNAPAIGGGLKSTEISTVVISGESNVAVMASAPDFEIANVIGNASGSEGDGVTIEDSVVVEEVVPVAQLKDGRFATLQAALDAVKAGNNEIILLADCDEDVIIHQQEGINITIKGDGANTKYTGSMEIYGHARYTGAETVTIDGIYFDGSAKTAAHDFIHQNTTDSVKRYAHNVTIKNCHFEGSDNADVVATRFRQCYNIKVEDCTFSNLHSVMWATGVSDGLAFDGITAENCKNGISTGTSANVVVENSTIKTTSETGYGVRTDGSGAYSLTIKNVDIEAYYPVIVRKASNDGYELNIEEECDFTATNPEGYDIAVTSDSDDKPLVAPTNDIQITIDETVDASLFSSHVALIGDTFYKTLEAAADAAQIGDVIDLLGNEIEITSIKTTKKMHTKNLTFQNGTMDFTNAVAGNSLFDMTANQSIKFKDMTLLIKDRAEGSKMCYWMDLRSPSAVAYFENCVIDFDAVQYSYICANGDGKVFFTGCTIEAEQANFVYRAGATFDNCTFDGYADLSEGENAGNIILWAAVPCTIKNSTVNTRQLGSISANGTIAIVENSYVYAERVRHYYAAGSANYTPGLVTVDATSTLEAVELDMGMINEDSEGIINTEASAVYVQYKKVDSEEGTAKYEIVLVGANNNSAAELINELASADLTFDFNGTPVTGGAMSYTVAPAKGVSLAKIGDRYLFNYDGVTKYEESGLAIVIGTITINGYGSYTLGTKDVPTNAVYATEIRDNIVDGFTPAAGLEINKDMAADDGMVGKVEGEDAVIAVPTRELTITIDFPNGINENVAAYQDMKVEITGVIDGVNQTVTYDLGSGEESIAMVNGSYVVTEDRLVLNNAYTVVVRGAGYRTARYTVTMTDKKALRFWNNVRDEAQVVEVGETDGAVKVTFLAGDIVKDNTINIYDLSAVVSYFGSVSTTENGYAKYDLNRDSVVDSKDVAYVLVSWNN